MKSKYFLLIFALVAFANSLFAQSDLAGTSKIFYRNEKTVALNLSTNGWGLGYRYGSRLNYFEKRLYEVEFSIVKHPKEIKTSSTFMSSESFVFGKLNSVYDLRFAYGKQNELYGKGDKRSVAIRYFYSFGPSVAFLKPIYYEINDPVNDTFRIKTEKFNPDIHTSGDINGKASYFTGFNEMKLVPGAFLKLGFNFEFSQSEVTVHALEVGAMLQAYTNSLEIMAVDDNQQFFLTLFVCYRIGRIVNAQEISEDYLKKRKRRFLGF